MREQYKTVHHRGESEYIDRKSRFLGYCAPVVTEEDAVAFVASIRELHKTASHHVYAYCLRARNISRYSDDGEPQGSAGLPALDVLKRGELVDAAVVVTRYFGGTLLGTGGLARAYTQATALAVQNAGIVVMRICSVYEIVCAYPLFDRMQALLGACDAAILENLFADQITLTVSIAQTAAPAMLRAVSELSRGQVAPRHLYDRYSPTQPGKNLDNSASME